MFPPTLKLAVDSTADGVESPVKRLLVCDVVHEAENVLMALFLSFVVHCLEQEVTAAMAFRYYDSDAFCRLSSLSVYDKDFFLVDGLKPCMTDFQLEQVNEGKPLHIVAHDEAEFCKEQTVYIVVELVDVS